MSLMLALVLSLAGTPPTDDDLRARIEAYQKAWATLFESGHARSEDVAALRAEALDQVDVGTLSARQIAMLNRARIVTDGEVRHQAIQRLEELKDERSVEGATTAVLLLQLEGGVTQQHRPDPELQSKLLQAALRHPALAEAVAAGDAVEIFRAVRTLAEKSVWRVARDDLLGLERLLVDEMPPALSLGFDDYYEVLGHVLDEEHEPVRQRIRARMVELARQAKRDIEAGRVEMPPWSGEWLGRLIVQLDSAPARGEFIGHPAVPLELLWSSDASIKGMNDLRGKVVVLDFWATWCGPCVGSFPQVRELVTHYDGYPVAIVGVTSIQGSVVLGDGPVDCKDDRTREFSLMSRYIDEKNITWPIVFTEQDVFNPEYDVSGIPHVVILDPKGTVRFSGVHPADPLPEKVEKINALLDEFELPAPTITRD